MGIRIMNALLHRVAQQLGGCAEVTHTSDNLYAHDNCVPKS
jgi:hypothetical protein